MLDALGLDSIHVESFGKDGIVSRAPEALEKYGNVMGNAVILAEKNAQFIRTWQSVTLAYPCTMHSISPCRLHLRGSLLSKRLAVDAHG